MQVESIEELRNMINNLSTHNINSFALEKLNDKHMLVIDYNDNIARELHQYTIILCFDFDRHLDEIKRIIEEKNKEIKKSKKREDFWNYLSSNFFQNKWFWILIMIIILMSFGFDIPLKLLI